MANELAERIRAEIASVEAEIDVQKHLIKKGENVDLWDVEVKMRSLRIRLEELERNLRAIMAGYGPPV